MAPSGGSGSGGVQIGGDIGGTNATPVVTGIQGKAVAATAPTNAQVLIWNASLSEYVPGPVVAAPAADVKYVPAGVSDGGAAYAGGLTRYDNNEPQSGSVNPAVSGMGYLAFNATPALPQYAEQTVALPPYWTGTALTVQFYSAYSDEWQRGVGGAIVLHRGERRGGLFELWDGGHRDHCGKLDCGRVGDHGIGDGGREQRQRLPGNRGDQPLDDDLPDIPRGKRHAAGNANLLGVTLVTGRSQ